MTVTELNIIGFLHKDYILNKTNFTLLDPNGTQLFSCSKSSLGVANRFHIVAVTITFHFQ
jgi:hypothetical protein